MQYAHPFRHDRLHIVVAVAIHIEPFRNTSLPHEFDIALVDERTVSVIFKDNQQNQNLKRQGGLDVLSVAGSTRKKDAQSHPFVPYLE